MTTYIEDEQSIEDGEPRLAIEIELPAVTYRLATGDRDLVVDGNTYRKAPIDSGPFGVAQVDETRELEISLPVDHAVPRRYTRQALPPQFLRVTVRRVQLRSGQAQVVFRGDVTSMAIDGSVAKLLVASRLGEALQRRIPTITAGRGCPHVLYDANCRAPRLSFTVITSVLSSDGAAVTLTSDGGKPDQWFQFGELIHIPSGERVTIFDHTGDVVTLQFPVVDMQAGDTVAVAAGCAHDITTCFTKFGNQANFGGAPQMPDSNPMIPGKNLGVITQT